MGNRNTHNRTQFQKQTNHAKLRFKRSHGERLTRNFRRTLKGLIQEDADCVTLIEESRGKQKYEVCYNGEKYKIVYDPATKNIVTFLPN